jgi:hypothetical protein
MRFAFLLGLALTIRGVTQQPAPSAESTFRIESNLVLLDVMTPQSGDPVGKLQRDDFRVFENGRPVTIKTFDVGDAARPLALWFVVQCNMEGWETKGSGLFRGQIERMAPAMSKLGRQDKVAVAHWCDDGDSAIDLRPTANFDQAETAIEAVLEPIPDPQGHDRSGELALQKTLAKIIAASQENAAGPIPVVVFLYGDYSGMPKAEADRFVEDLLHTSAIVYGLRDDRSPRIGSMRFAHEQGAVANYLATQTGGEYFSATPDGYAAALETILNLLHARYELGFRPEVLDGKLHRLRVELSDQAKKRFGAVQLRYRAAYVPASRARH